MQQPFIFHYSFTTTPVQTDGKSPTDSEGPGTDPELASMPGSDYWDGQVQVWYMGAEF